MLFESLLLQIQCRVGTNFEKGTGPYRWDTLVVRTGWRDIGNPRHRIEPAPVGVFCHLLTGPGNDKKIQVKERRVLDTITQPNEHTFR